MTDEVLEAVERGVATITLNRPERLNALTRTAMIGLVETLQRAAINPDIGCVVLTGAGKAFCAGGDVQVQAEIAAHGASASPEQRADDLRQAMEASRLLHEMPKPTIAMLNGVAAGAGFSLALACDLRVAGESARLTPAFAKVGLSGDFGGTWFLSRLVGPALARELYFTSDMLDIRRIERLGLANRIVADAELRATTMELARRLASGPRVAWRYMKRNFAVAEHGTLSDVLDSETFGMMRCRETDDHREAARSFVAKQEPVFRGR